MRDMRRGLSWQWAPATENDAHDIMHTRATECDCGWTGTDHRLCHERHDDAHHEGNDLSFCWKDCCQDFVEGHLLPAPPP